MIYNKHNNICQLTFIADHNADLFAGFHFLDELARKGLGSRPQRQSCPICCPVSAE
jgi:hypothetical protein